MRAVSIQRVILSILTNWYRGNLGALLRGSQNSGRLSKAVKERGTVYERGCQRWKPLKHWELKGAGLHAATRLQNLGAFDSPAAANVGNTINTTENNLKSYLCAKQQPHPALRTMPIVYVGCRKWLGRSTNLWNVSGRNKLAITLI